MREFYNVHDHIVSFFLFLPKKNFDIFQKLFFVGFLYFLDDIKMNIKKKKKKKKKKIYKNICKKMDLSKDLKK